MTNNNTLNHLKASAYLRSLLCKVFSHSLLLVIFFAFADKTSAQTIDSLYQTPGQFTFIIPEGVTQITVEAWGGGGAGGGARNGRGGGGAGGAFVRSTLTVVPGTSYTVNVGDYKTSTYNSSAASNKGNPSWFGSTTTVFADGGAGGGPANGNNGTAGAGTNSTSIGTTKYRGGSGTAGGSNGTGGGGAGSTGQGQNGTSSGGGAGASEFGGNGGGIASNNSNGLSGGDYAGGGSGARSNNTSQTRPGGTGAKGMIRISYTVPEITASAVTTPSCEGTNPGTGSITVTASGGTPPYQYKLGSGSYQASNVFLNISSGTYSITVKDNANITLVLNNITVGSQASSMNDLTAVVTNSSCNLPNGAIEITNIPISLQFTKSNSTYVDLGSSLLNNLSQFTLEGWLKIDKSLISGDRTWGLFGQNDAIEIGIMNSTTLQLWTASGGSVNIPMSSYPDDDQWHHIAGVGTGTSLIVYIDGVVVTGTGSGTTTSNYGSSTYHGMIGGNIWDASGNFLEGDILKTGFWNRALSAAEILNLVNNPFHQYTASDNGLIAGYNFFEGTGTTLSKIGSATTHGTLVNSPQWSDVFTYSWIKSGDPSFSASTRHINSILAGTYTLTATFPGMCPTTGTWDVFNSGNNLWTGNLNTDWNNISNWTCAIPDLTLDAIIPSGLNRYPTLNTGSQGMCKNIEIQSGASVTVLNNTLQIAGTILNNGTFDATQGTVEMKGTSAQILPANCFSGNAVGNLTINNSNGVTLNGTLYIYGILKAASGNLQTNGFLTLLSTPVQTALIDGTGTGSVNGNVTVQRYLPSAFGYKYFSSPFTNATVAQYSQEINLSAPFATLYSYTENLTSTGWQAYTSASGTLQPGQGYALNFGTTGTPITVSVTGIVNNGQVGPITLYNHNQPYTKGFNLVGNPYPSPINWNAAGWTKTNIDNALYFFDAGTTDQYLGTYSSYINGVSSNGIASNIIAAQQGFFIHVKDGAYPVQGTLAFTNTVRTNTLNPHFHKNTSTEEKPIIRLSASKQGTERADFLVIYISDDATAAFNPELDALKLKNTDPDVPNLYTTSGDGRELSIKSIAYPSAPTCITDLGLTIKFTGQVTLSAENLVNIPSGYNVYLKDSYSGIIRNLSVNPDYSFSSEATTYNDRFKLILSSEDISQGAFTPDSFIAYSKEGTIWINLKHNDNDMFLQLTDITGRVVLRKQLYEKGEFSLCGVKRDQVYIVSLITGKGILSKKVYVD